MLLAGGGEGWAGGTYFRRIYQKYQYVPAARLGYLVYVDWLRVGYLYVDLVDYLLKHSVAKSTTGVILKPLALAKLTIFIRGLNVNCARNYRPSFHENKPKTLVFT
jgi:hypothetical protein